MTHDTRDEHLAWCKKRALEYLDAGDIKNAVTSMLSDLSKHPDTNMFPKSFATMGMTVILSQDESFARRFIEGFR